MSAPITLPALPDTIRTLSDPESDRLKRQHPGLWANPHTSCETCGGEKVFRMRVAQEIVECACECIDQWVLHRFLLNAGIGTAYQRLTWDDIDDQVPLKVQAEVLQYADQADAYVRAGLGLILHGPHGTGKTLLATLLLKKLLGLGYDGYFTQFNELLDSYTSGWRDEEERLWFTRKVRNTGVLVVDDVGKESKGRENVTSPMFDAVIRARVADAKPTIITTNYSMEQMHSGYGGAVMSLLAESSKDLEVTGKDYRQRSRERLLQDALDNIVRPLMLG